MVGAARVAVVRVFAIGVVVVIAVVFTGQVDGRHLQFHLGGKHDRAQVRARIHYWLGIPDRMRIALHPGEPEDAAAARRLLDAARQFSAARNDIAVAVTRSTGDTGIWQELAHEVARLTATRRLFFVPKAPEDASWLLACEVLLTSSAAMAERFAEAATEAGSLPCQLGPSDADVVAECMRRLDQLTPPPAGLNL